MACAVEQSDRLREDCISHEPRVWPTSMPDAHPHCRHRLQRRPPADLVRRSSSPPWHLQQPVMCLPRRQLQPRCALLQRTSWPTKYPRVGHRSDLLQRRQNQRGCCATLWGRPPPRHPQKRCGCFGSGTFGIDRLDRVLLTLPEGPETKVDSVKPFLVVLTHLFGYLETDSFLVFVISASCQDCGNCTTDCGAQSKM